MGGLTLLSLTDKSAGETMATYSAVQLRRLSYIDVTLREHKCPNAKELSRPYGCSKRTIERDIERLRDDFGAPVYFDYARGGYAYSDPTFVLPAVRLTQGELLAIYLAEQVLQQYTGSPLHQHLSSAFRKVAAYLPEEVSVDISELGATFSFDPGPVRNSEGAQFFKGLTEAIAAHRTVAIDYFSQYRNALTHRELDPYHITNYRGDWYVSGFCHLRYAVRDFAVTRIRKLEILDKEFKVAADFDREQYLDRQFGIEKGARSQGIALKFSPEQSRWMLEKSWHQSEEKEMQADGSLIMKMHVPVTGELKRWVMSFGKEVEVLEPDELRDIVGKEVQELAETYRL